MDGQTFFEELGPNIEDIWIGLKHVRDMNPTLESLVSKNGRHLKHLGLIVRDFNSTDWSIIGNNMDQLNSFKLTFGSTGKASLDEFSKFKNLEYLALAEESLKNIATVLTDDSLLSMLKGCTKLKSLYLAGTKPDTLRVSIKTIRLIGRLCPNIKQLKFIRANSIFDSTLAGIGENFISISIETFINSFHYRQRDRSVC